MPQTISKKFNAQWFGLITRATGAVAATVMLGACSQVPDSVNPVEWYNSTVEFFSGDDKDEAQTRDDKVQPKQSALARDAGKTPPGSDQKFPTLSRVDRQNDYAAARQKGGLVADVQGRQYAPAIARQGEPGTRLAAAPPEPPKASVSVTQAMPASPVKQAPQVASLTASDTLPGLPTTAEQQAFEMRLRKQLAEIRARASMPGPALPMMNSVAMASLAANNFGTVVVSSTGIESGVQPKSAVMAVSSSATTPQPAGASRLGGLSYMKRQPMPLAPGAVRIATIQFENGSARLSAADRRILANVRQLQRERGGRLHIVGHASSRTRTMDPVRHKMINFKVSIERANVIARELMHMGFMKEQLLVDAVSDTVPLYYEFMPTGEAANRRAEIYLES